MESSNLHTVGHVRSDVSEGWMGIDKNKGDNILKLAVFKTSSFLREIFFIIRLLNWIVNNTENKRKY